MTMNDARGIYLTWQKGKQCQLSEFFHTSEFDCKCKYPECREQRVSLELLRRLDWLRKASNSSIRIHSGFRCRAYQADLLKKSLDGKGQLTVVAKISTHELGDAADISVGSLTIPELKPLVEQKFESIGIALSFLHVDIREGRRRWTY